MLPRHKDSTPLRSWSTLNTPAGQVESPLAERTQDLIVRLHAFYTAYPNLRDFAYRHPVQFFFLLKGATNQSPASPALLNRIASEIGPAETRTV